MKACCIKFSHVGKYSSSVINTLSLILNNRNFWITAFTFTSISTVFGIYFYSFSYLVFVLLLEHGFELPEHGPRLARRVEIEGGEDRQAVATGVHPYHK